MTIHLTGVPVRGCEAKATPRSATSWEVWVEHEPPDGAPFGGGIVLAATGEDLAELARWALGAGVRRLEVRLQ